MKRDQISGYPCQGDRGCGAREPNEGGQKVQTFSYKISKSWGCNVQDDDSS